MLPWSDDKLKPRKLKQVYRFGNKRHIIIGALKIEIQFFKTHFIDFTADVVDINVQFWLDLKALTKFKALLDIENDVILSLTT